MAALLCCAVSVSVCVMCSPWGRASCVAVCSQCKAAEFTAALSVTEVFASLETTRSHSGSPVAYHTACYRRGGKLVRGPPLFAYFHFRVALR